MFTCKFYIQGLPFDVKSREIHNLATRFEGCVRSYLEFCSGMPVGILEFSNLEAARHAAVALHNYPFDRDNQQYISVNFPHYSFPDASEYNTMGMQRMWGGQNRQQTNDIQREEVVPAQEKRKIIIKHLDQNTDEAELRAIFQRHMGFKTLRIIPKIPNVLVFVEFDFSQAAYDAVDEYSDGFSIQSSRTRGKVELAKDDKRPQQYQRHRSPLRIQPRQLLRRNSEPGPSTEHADLSVSPKNKRDEDQDATEEVVKKKNRTSPSSSDSSSSDSASSSSASEN